MEFYIGMAFGAVFMGLAFLADHYVFGLPSERTLERARREAYFRRFAREEALRQDEQGRA
jgi:uncharacterized protein (DUF2062 family)